MRRTRYLGLIILTLSLGACGSTSSSSDGGDLFQSNSEGDVCSPQNLLTDVNNCGTCNHRCQGLQSNQAGQGIPLGAWICQNGTCWNNCNPPDGGVVATPDLAAPARDAAMPPSDLSVIPDLQAPVDAAMPGDALMTDMAVVIPDMAAAVPDMAIPVMRGPPNIMFCPKEQLCVDVSYDNSHCGNCMTACSDEQFCDNGVCKVDCSATGRTDCNNKCVDTRVDSKNCGSCGLICADGKICSASVCLANCLGGQQECSGLCVSLPFDGNNCGACGTKCNAGAPVCSNGSCTMTCQQGLNACPGSTACYNFLTDPLHCGSCPVTCIPGEVCSLGRCQTRCDPGLTACGASCVDLTTDFSHCGTCDVFCPGSAPYCTGGKCSIGCGMNEKSCNGKCSNTAADTANCGACSNGDPKASSVCLAGQVCGTSNGMSKCILIKDCPQSVTCNDCSCIDKVMTCIDFANDPKNCHSCGRTCPGLHITTPTCGNGQCNGACDPGWADCNNDKYTDGCETHIIGGDTNNCGACGVICSTNNLDVKSVVCSLVNGGDAGTSGICNGTCVNGYADCNNNKQLDGCEANLGFDLQNCGACGLQCAPANATGLCGGGVCKIAKCNLGFADCNLNAGDGCEIDLTKDQNNCGKCGSQCIVANGTGGCNNGNCQITCTAPYADCNKNLGDGCEANLNTDANNCMVCGSKCQLANVAVNQCSGGSCIIGSCVAGFTDCNAHPLDGCEKQTSSDLMNCGNCGVVCSSVNGTPTCANSTCSIACLAGYANCDNNVTKSGCAIHLTNDVNNCGACASPCSLNNAVPKCNNSSCEILNCSAGYFDCDLVAKNGCEVNLLADVKNCNACGKVCSTQNGSPSCSQGTCQIACTTGFADCNKDVTDGCEVSLNFDANNCGVCNNICAFAHAGALCVSGKCTLGNCAAGFADCNGIATDGCETNLTADPNNCGSCNSACNRNNGTPVCTASVCSITCDKNFADCNRKLSDGCEANVNTDVTNCGTCGIACNLPNATPLCNAGACAISSCNTGFADCDGISANGCEVHTSNDVTKCGTCTTACSNVNGTPSCINSQCQISCLNGFGNCDGIVAHGCSTVLTTDVNNCGACANVCSLPNAIPKCSSGACAVSSCLAGFFDCDTQPKNGCEVNLTADTKNCGACGKLCSQTNGTPSCFNSTCTIACTTGFADCDHDVTNGCEASLNFDASNCGVCKNVCSFANAGAVCVNGSCKLGTCSGGFGDCNGIATDGCEANLNSDPKNCSACARACSSNHGIASCTAGACSISCDAGFADCDKDVTNGCEAAIGSDTLNCSACGIVCNLPNATPACNSGKCVVTSCNTGYANCDGLSANGCEVHTSNDVTNCGACNNACSNTNGTPSCVNSLCQIACTNGFANCDGIAAHGCSTVLATDISNCGSCGNACSLPNATPLCNGGVCKISQCNGNFQDCDGNAANGCEADIKSNAQNCGACKIACSSVGGTPNCALGVCQIVCSPGYGDCNNNAADGCEVNTSNNLTNCGGCGIVCNLPHATPVCVSGACKISACAGGWTDCDGIAATGCEVSLSTDVNNCGACNKACNSANATVQCLNNVCQISACAAGFADCNHDVSDGCEANLQADPLHCGTCATVCSTAGGTASCSPVNGVGVCSIACSTGFANCDKDVTNGCEVSLNTDVNHCGACATVCSTVQNSPTCNSGVCKLGVCSAGFADCDANPANGCEVNLKTDIVNCNACGTKCSTAQNTPICNGGTCQLGTCNTGYGDCNGLASDGCEVSLQTDTTNCGACKTVCSTNNDTPSCVGGFCKVTCLQGYADCDANVATGCEVSTNTDVNNCGGCKIACNLPNAVPACVAGACRVNSCSGGFLDCNGLVADGCEVNPATDTQNCGACKLVCSTANGTASCSSGLCKIACSLGFADCDGNVANGCEVNLKTDTSNCGGCKAVCAPANAIGQCAAGVCSIGSCVNGYGDCNGVAADGCEAVLASDVKNCGACNTVCNLANATAQCVIGVCKVSQCANGFVDCNGLAADGCEVNTAGDPLHCGTCTTVCSTVQNTPTCSSGVCKLGTCNAGYADCNGLASDGCETNTAGDPLHCGTCATVCSTVQNTPTCNGGVCKLGLCNASYADCDGLASTGCETNINTDATHCGTCATVCSTVQNTPTCNSGVCKLGACNAGFGDCDGLATNGCEAKINTDILNCGACGNKCSTAGGTASCAAGVCAITCSTGFFDCDGNVANGCEVNSKTDANNCGACNTVCAFANAVPQCTNSACSIASCLAGYANCDGLAANGCESLLASDVANCGACNAACNPPHATAVCASGSCKINTCANGYVDCNLNPADGCEVNTAADPVHCGTCTNVCSTVQNTPTCTAGLCKLGTCNAGFADCDMNVTNGCETNTKTDINNCGGCSMACAPANATGVCSASTCTIGSCNTGFADCDVKVANGCEVNIASGDSSNCGGCGKVCSTNHCTATCQSSSCVDACLAGFGNCNGLATDGCEVTFGTDVNNCGNCGNVCNLPNATPRCATGACAISTCNAGYFDCDALPANGCEVNLLADVSHCGACGTVCSTVNDTPQCTSGACKLTCNSGFADCDANVATGCEANIKTDVLNCGGCGTTCSTVQNTPTCNAGSCKLGTCNAGYGDCDNLASTGCETNLQTDKLNCGGCNLACSTNHIVAASCSAGVCNGACAAGYADCNGNKQTDGCETAITADTMNCGGCNTVCSTNNISAQCAGGSCNAGVCLAGFADCNANKQTDGCETPTTVDVLNCGGCNVVCSSTNITRACAAGSCNAGVCLTGFADCNANKQTDGCETPVSADVLNCGGCGTVCSTNNIARACASSSCSAGVCTTGFADCNANKQTDGCEVNINTSVANCGGCTMACPGTNMATNTCTAGSCTGTCSANFADCDTNLRTNGCEVNLLTDKNNCSACGTVCSSNNITPACAAGSCNAGVCTAGFSDCNANKQTDGCETPTSADVSNCGGCNVVCSMNNIAAACASSSCSAGVCTAGFADCNANKQTDGCEVDINTSVANCGGCTMACPGTNMATNTCTAGSCTGTCSANFADCDTNLRTNGCEVNLLTDKNNCSACGTVCSSNNITPACAAGSCSAGVCTAGFSDCNANKQTDGCETPTSADVLNCGGCNVVCSTNNIARACASSSCNAGVCASGFADCNANKQTDGCETATTADVMNCGGCGTVCSTNNITRACAASSCSTGVCAANFGDCNNNKQTDGCEANLLTDKNNCSACGMACAAGQICSGGACICDQTACGLVNGCCSGISTCVTAFTTLACNVGGSTICSSCAGNANGTACVGSGASTHCGCSVVGDCAVNKACTTATKLCGNSCNPGVTTSNCNTGCCGTGTCQNGTAKGACGSTGAACVSCGNNLNCNGTSCQ